MTTCRTLALAACLATAACQSPAQAPAPRAVAQGGSPCPEAAADAGSGEKVLVAARAFMAALTPEQRARVVNPFELKNATRWSNYPAAIVPRAGVAYGDLSPAAARAADTLIVAAAGACGAALFNGARASDAISHAINPYIGPESHFISFNGEPSERAPWMLMFGGHHNAFNLVFNEREPGATPLFAGSDPRQFVDADGAVREPLQRQSRALAEMAGSVAADPDARFPGVFTDLTRSAVPIGPPPAGPRPGQPREPAPDAQARAARTAAAAATRGVGFDAAFPIAYPTGTTGRGVAYARMTPEQQALVRRAIEAYAALSGPRLSAPLLALYEAPAALAQTYVGFSGDPGLDAANSYVRIDGPRVWIELSVQESLNDGLKTHFHSIWRDKLSDYGGHFRSTS